MALILAILLGAIANQWIIQSVTHISDVAKAISHEQIANIEEHPKIKEFAIVTQSLNAMASQLHNSAQNIENLESQWEKRVEETTKNLKQVNQELSRLANIDGLTQIYNRYYFDLTLQQFWQEAISERGSISLILCDVDNFKLYNDTYGHVSGDECLKKVAQTIKNSINRSQDIATRYGGEEFAVILPRTNAQGAMKIAEIIRDAVSSLNIIHRTSTVEKYVTISCGVACFSPHPNLPPSSLVKSADRALYRAKQQSRNCCVMAELNT